MAFKKRTVGKPGEWYYCLKHHKAEEGPECPAKNRLGPYATRAEAEHALETVSERNREWDTDPRWGDEDPQDSPGAPGGGSHGG
ncbi:hypothetical protein GCM10018793_16470 [Streptomyces sulfonofaciens]|uniref:SPOR domain-containing protein n=2 Tax=Streptomyces sulfonofaciens TaxID=68272 RepID=A0A919KWN0_9ACTN|nr:hypothetical protein GCM10018793_16470 [Streptomyces sulfonofaciens]